MTPARNALDTPALVVDLDIMDANIARIAAACRESGVRWRPHIKGVKTPEIILRMLAAGAVGVTCAKLGEAELMAAVGVRDILIANQIVGAEKIARLVALLDRALTTVAVDSIANIDALSKAAARAACVLPVVIEVDIGMKRAGVNPGGAVAALADAIAARPGLRLRGVMGWESHAIRIADRAEKEQTVVEAVGLLTASAEACRAAGHTIDIVSCGGTGTYWVTAEQPGITEIEAGGGVFCDVHYREHFGVAHPYALTMMTGVSSRPTPTRIICDAGKKTMSSDAAVPAPIGLDHVRSVRLSAEHATIELDAPNAALRVGDRLEWVVGYSDTTVHLHDEIYAVRNGRVEAVWPILGRGKLR
jgi:D-serine deaminase-like pyridoxal phosphate-dependent protein